MKRWGGALLIAAGVLTVGAAVVRDFGAVSGEVRDLPKRVEVRGEEPDTRPQKAIGAALVLFGVALLLVRRRS